MATLVKILAQPGRVKSVFTLNLRFFNGNGTGGSDENYDEDCLINFQKLLVKFSI